jgi:hypothetical protein
MNTRKSGWVLLTASAWTFYVWITRGYNIARSQNTTQFKVAHYVLAVISLAFGIATAVIGARMVRKD